MSPFMHADLVNEPILLIHGEMDNNSGTFPMQSETVLRGDSRVSAPPRGSCFSRTRATVTNHASPCFTCCGSSRSGSPAM